MNNYEAKLPLLKELYDALWAPLMASTTNDTKKEEWRVAMGLTKDEQKTLIRLINCVGDLCSHYEHCAAFAERETPK